MKWGKKKGSSTSSHPSLIREVFSISWLSKLKPKKGICAEAIPVSERRKGHADLAQGSLSSSSREGRFYHGGNDEPYRTDSFGEKTGEKLKTSVKYPWFDEDDHAHQGFQVPRLRTRELETMERTRNAQTWKFNAMVSDNRKMKNMLHDEEILHECEAFRRKRVIEEEYLVKSPRRKGIEVHKLKKSNTRALREKQSQRGSEIAEQKTLKEPENIMFEVQSERTIRARDDLWKDKVAADTRKRRSFSFPNCNLGIIEEEGLLDILDLDEASLVSKTEMKGERHGMSNQRENFEDTSIKTMLSRDDEISSLISNDKNCQRRKRYQKRRAAKAYSPRTIAKIECKIRALEDMKKTRRKKKTAEKSPPETTVFDSYAIAKNSFDPERDFRDSMIEMIVVKGIEKPEELEKLLACYLTLNCDEYHDLIIKAFRQVWFELNEIYRVLELQNPHCYDHDQHITSFL